MGSSSSKKEKEEQEKREMEIKQKCLDTKEMLEEKIKNSEALRDEKFKEAKNLQEEAKKRLKEGDKIGAKRCLVKKKKLESLLETLNGELMMMDDQVIALENAIHFGQIKTTLQSAVNVLNQNKITVDEIEEEHEKIQDFKLQTGEVNQAIEEVNNEDDDEVLDYLEQCEKELTDEMKLPSANTEKLNKEGKNKNIDDELNMLSL